MRTASRVTAIQAVHSSRRGSRDIEHIGSAHEDTGLEALEATARHLTDVTIVAGVGMISAPALNCALIWPDSGYRW